MRLPISDPPGSSRIRSAATPYAGSSRNSLGRWWLASSVRTSRSRSGVAGRGVGQERRARAGVALQRGVEELVDLPPALGSHACESALQLARQPGTRHRPVALYRGGGDVHRLGGLLDGQAAEESQLDEPRLLRIERASRSRARVERDEIRSTAHRRRASASSSVTRGRAPAALLRAARARALDQDLPHRVRRDGAEVRAVLPALRPILQQPQIRLVDERRRLQRLPGTLAAQIARRQAPQLLVDDRQQRV